MKKKQKKNVRLRRAAEQRTPRFLSSSACSFVQMAFMLRRHGRSAATKTASIARCTRGPTSCVHAAASDHKSFRFVNAFSRNRSSSSCSNSSLSSVADFPTTLGAVCTDNQRDTAALVTSAWAAAAATTDVASITTRHTTRTKQQSVRGRAWAGAAARWLCSSTSPPTTPDGGKHATTELVEEAGVAAGQSFGSMLRFGTIVEGKEMLPEEFEGKAVLVVNTASLCG